MFLKMMTALALLAGTATVANAAGDATDGAQVFKRCAICHTTAKGGPNLIGPNLFGIVGTKAASRSGYSYSAALKKSGLTWTPETMDKWITSPARLVPGTKMAFAGIPKPEDRANVIAYLATLK
jgi:cytochrome c